MTQRNYRQVTTKWQEALELLKLATVLKVEATGPATLVIDAQDAGGREFRLIITAMSNFGKSGNIVTINELFKIDAYVPEESAC